MELQFNKTTVSCLDPVLREVQNMELTQELRLGDSMPDVGHVLCAWGQPVLRSKEWRMDSVSFGSSRHAATAMAKETKVRPKVCATNVWS